MIQGRAVHAGESQSFLFCAGVRILAGQVDWAVAPEGCPGGSLQLFPEAGQWSQCKGDAELGGKVKGPPSRVKPSASMWDPSHFFTEEG